MGHVQTKPKPMKTEIQSAAAAVATQTVRATINERNLFVTMKQWFASSFSFLGETMQNSRRAGASFVKFDLATPAEGELTLTITDDGCGFDPAADTENGGMGLTNMHDRAEKLGGHLSIETRPGAGAGRPRASSPCR